MRSLIPFAAGVAFFAVAAAAADTVYPARPIRLIVGYPPGE